MSCKNYITLNRDAQGLFFCNQNFLTGMKKNEKKYPCHSAVTMTLGTPVRSFGRLERSPGLPLPVAAPQPSHLTEAVKNRHKIVINYEIKHCCHWIFFQWILWLMILTLFKLFSLCLQPCTQVFKVSNPINT